MASFVWEQVVTGAEPAGMCVVVREGVMCIGVTLTETGYWLVLAEECTPPSHYQRGPLHLKKQ